MTIHPQALIVDAMKGNLTPLSSESTIQSTNLSWIDRKDPEEIQWQVKICWMSLTLGHRSWIRRTNCTATLMKLKLSETIQSSHSSMMEIKFLMTHQSQCQTTVKTYSCMEMNCLCWRKFARQEEWKRKLIPYPLTTLIMVELKSWTRALEESPILFLLGLLIWTTTQFSIIYFVPNSGFQREWRSLILRWRSSTLATANHQRMSWLNAMPTNCRLGSPHRIQYGLSSIEMTTSKKAKSSSQLVFERTLIGCGISSTKLLKSITDFSMSKTWKDANSLSSLKSTLIGSWLLHGKKISPKSLGSTT